MKRLLTALFCVSLLTSTVSLPIACGTTTKEAQVYNSFQTTWAVARNAYEGWCERVVLGKVSKEDERRVDNAWNKFRSTFSLGMSAARQDWSAQTPESLDKLQKDFVNLVRTLSK